MKSLELTSLELENFMKFQKQQVLFGHRTDLRGRNGVGKSTIMNAFYWVFFNSTPDGKQADNVRPLLDGVPVDYVDISAAFGVVINGKQHVIKKIQKQKWVKKTGQADKQFEGNINEFEIDGFPYKPKEYEQFLSDFIHTSTFLFCSNPQKFLSQPPSEQRKTLEQLFGFSAEEFASENSEFDGVADIMAGHSVEDTIKKLKKDKAKLDKEIKEIPVRIDEAKRVSEVVEISDIELQISGLKKQIEEIDSKLVLTDKSMEGVDLLRRGIMSLKMEKNNIEQQISDALLLKRRDIQRAIDNAKNDIRNYESQISFNQSLISQKESLLKKGQQEFMELQEKWRSEKETSFEEPADMKCPLCGSELPEEQAEAKITELKNNFEIEQFKKISKLESQGIDSKRSNKQLDSNINGLRTDIAKLNDEIGNLENAIEGFTKQLSKIAKEPDMSENQDYERICLELKSKEDALSGISTPDDNRFDLNAEKSKLLDGLSTWEAKKKKVLADDEEREKRVSELESNLCALSQKMSDVERQIDLVTRFGVEKNKRLSEVVNSNFELVKFKFSKPLINGGVEDCCQIEVNGINYYQTLNTGAKKLAEIDLVRGFQKVNDLNLPVFLDEASEVDPDRIPELEQQLITMSRTDDERLKVEVSA